MIYTNRKISLSLSIGILFLLIIITSSSCKKFVPVDAPVTSTTNTSVFTSDATAVAAVTAIYASMSAGEFATGENSVSLFAGLSADELTLWSGINPDNVLYYYYRNELHSTSMGADPGTQTWRSIYPLIFNCNSSIEGLNASNSLNPGVKRQLLGESKFMRAYLYFYLVNLYGDVPLLLSTDYRVNSLLSRSSKSEVYAQMIADLKDAKELLSGYFVDASTINESQERVRPTKWAAASLLARIYLYNENWIEAESEATLVLDQTSLFSLSPLNGTFLANSSEAIWQLQPVVSDWNTLDGRLFILPSTGPNNSFPAKPVYMNESLVNSFEIGDLRRQSGGWIDSVFVDGSTYYYPTKYRVEQSSSLTEYLMVFRLAELYLIRSESRAQQDDIVGAGSDLNAVRSRAGLPNTAAIDKSAMLNAVFAERRYELFTEWGHRWLDLKRASLVDSVMNTSTPLKADGRPWQSFQQLYPLPLVDIQRDRNLVQNTGY